MLCRDSPAVIVFWRNCNRLATMRARCFDANLAPSRLDLANLAMQLEPFDGMKAKSDGRGLRKNDFPIASRRAASVMTPKVTAGQLFFIIVGVSVTSRAPASNNRFIRWS